jgi:hypothetical protein
LSLEVFCNADTAFGGLTESMEFDLSEFLEVHLSDESLAPGVSALTDLEDLVLGVNEPLLGGAPLLLLLLGHFKTFLIYCV